MRGTTFIAAALVGAAALSTHAVADACSTPCVRGSMGLEVGSSVPANAPGFPFSPTQPYGVPKVDGGGSPKAMALLGADGKEIPIRLLTDGASYFVAPEAPLTPGDYSFSFYSDCALGSRFALPFHATEPMPFPDNAGTLNVTYEKRPVSVWTSAGYCYDEVMSATAKLEVAPSDALKPWLPLVRWQVYVDGALWTENADASKSFPPPASGNRIVFAGCTTTDAGGKVGIDRGKHRVGIAAEIPNGPTTPVIERDIDLQCDDDSNAADNGCSVVPTTSPNSTERSLPFPLMIALGFGTIGASRYFTKRIRRESR